MSTTRERVLVDAGVTAVWVISAAASTTVVMTAPSRGDRGSTRDVRVKTDIGVCS